MKALMDHILQFGNLNQQQLDFIMARATALELRKGDYFSEAGKIPRRIAFILEGVFRFSYYNIEGEDITSYFIDGNQFIVDYQKFDAQMAATEYLQAVTDSRILVFSKREWDEISSTVGGWDKIVDRMFKKCLLDAIEKRSPLVSVDATSRYLSFIEKYPSLLNRIPLSHVASYLGIRQQSLSRIRKNIH